MLEPTAAPFTTGFGATLRRVTIMAGGVASLCLALTGCGGSGPAGGTPTPTPTQTPTETRTELEIAAANCVPERSRAMQLLDEGMAVEMKTPGEGAEAFGLEWEQVECVLKKTGASSAVWEKMLHTRALDGTLTESWEGYEASWTYHPDSGMNVILENKK